MENQELRAYFFTNMYVVGIHAGIQAQHCTTEMFLKYQPDGFVPESLGCMEHLKEDILYDWARDYKTTIILNGGYQGNLERITTILDNENNPYPWDFFCESDDALKWLYDVSGYCSTRESVQLPYRL